MKFIYISTECMKSTFDTRTHRTAYSESQVKKKHCTSRTFNNTNLWWMFVRFNSKCQRTKQASKRVSGKKPSIYLLTARINVKQMVSLSNWSSVCLRCFITVAHLNVHSVTLIQTIHLNNICIIEFTARFNVWISHRLCRTKESFISSHTIS